MKRISKKILAVLGSGLILGMGVQAQSTAISTFPYVADFGTIGNAGTDNAYWQFKAFDMANDYSVINSEQWSFSALPSTENLAVCLNKIDNMEDQAAAFSPQFYMEKKGNVRYTVSVNFSVENADLFSGETLVVRLHATDASANPYFFSDGGMYYDSEEPIKEGDVIKSTFLYNHNGVPRTGNSTYTYNISSDKVPADGNYRISFIIVHKANKKAVKADAKLYITAFELKKEIGVDLAAGQILSPYTDAQASGQPFSAYVINNTSVEVEGFSATYQIDNQTPVTQRFSDKLAAEKPHRISFSAFPEVSSGNHRIRFWVDNENDTEHGNDTSVVYIKAGASAVAGIPVYYNFTEALPYGWTLRSDSDYVDPQWRFVAQDNNTCPYINTDKLSGRANNDYLVTQPMSFKKGLMYRIVFTYRAVLESGSAMGDLSLALYVCQNASESSVASRQNLIWKKNRFDDRGDRRVVVYFHATEDANRVLAFHAYGPSAEGGLQLKNLSVYQDEPNQLDYFFDFDGNSNEDPQYLVEKNMDFIDNDGNVSTTGQAENWELWGENSGYNSSYSVRSQGTAAKTGMSHSVSDDWMVYRPFYLEKGKPYYLKFFTKMSSDKSGVLEYYVQGNGIRYDLAYGSQPGIKGRKVVSSVSYDTVRRVFEVEKDGYYLLAIRNVTDVPEVDDNIVSTEYTVYVDNVSLSSIDKSSVQVMEANVPFEARLGKTVSLSMTVRNFSVNPIEPAKISYCYQVGDGEVCREHPGYPLLAQVKITHTFNKQAVFDQENTQTVKFWVETEDSDEKQDTVRIQVQKIEVKDLPFVDKFGENSMSEWQTYPATRSIWQMQHGENTAHSGAWAAKCDGGNMAVSDFLVSPLLNVEKEKTYRISFFYKRAGETGGLADSISLYYAYNRYDNTGFRNKIDVFKQVVSTEYDYLETYVHFPDSGVVFIGLKADLAARTPVLYVDDFIMVDSMQTTLTYYTLSNLVVSGNMSECDTISVGQVSFKVTAGGFSMPSTIPVYLRYDNGSAKDVSVEKEMMDGEEATLSFDMPMFSGGQHKVTAWIALADEADRSDDTVSVAFNVHEPQAVPFVETEMNIVGAPRMTDCFVVDSVGTYKIRYVYNAAEANGSSLQVSLSRYGQNSITQAIPVENISVSGTQAREKEIDIKETGVYAISFACTDLLTGGILRIDSVCIGKKTVESSANRVFGPQEFRLQPNPATDFVEVVLPADARTLTVFDIQGRICHRFVLQGQEKVMLSLQDFRPGVYVVGVAGNNRYGTLKLIRQ